VDAVTVTVDDSEEKIDLCLCDELWLCSDDGVEEGCDGQEILCIVAGECVNEIVQSIMEWLWSFRIELLEDNWTGD
jgi:hypothetical protein